MNVHLSSRQQANLLNDLDKPEATTRSLYQYTKHRRFQSETAQNPRNKAKENLILYGNGNDVFI